MLAGLAALCGWKAVDASPTTTSTTIEYGFDDRGMFAKGLKPINDGFEFGPAIFREYTGVKVERDYDGWVSAYGQRGTDAPWEFMGTHDNQFEHGITIDYVTVI